MGTVILFTMAFGIFLVGSVVVGVSVYHWNLEAKKAKLNSLANQKSAE